MFNRLKYWRFPPSKLASNSNSDVIEKIGKYQIAGARKRRHQCVYLAMDPFANRKVAIKVVQREVLG